MTRNFGTVRIIHVTTRSRSRSAAIDYIGFSCFRLVGDTTVPVEHAWSAMRAFLTRRL
jgi:hypothetical protein